MQKKVIVISGPSGVGKTTLYRHILGSYDKDMGFSVSVTTRQPREGEQDGRDYYFLSVDQFERLIQEEGLLEYENNYGNYYGTLKSEITRIWGEGKHCFLDLGVKGALAIKKIFPDEACLIFIAPPSLEVLRGRLFSRGSDQNLEARLKNAEREIACSNEYHHIIINSCLEEASQELDAVIQKIVL